MSMSKKDYVAIADAINNSTSGHSSVYCLKSDTIERLQEYFKKDNPNFDAEKFLEACNAHP